MIKWDLVRSFPTVGVVIILLVSVIAVFMSPAVDLPPTAFRALKLACMLFAFIASAASILAGLFSRVVFWLANTEADSSSLPAPNLVDMNCTRLC